MNSHTFVIYENLTCLWFAGVWISDFESKCTIECKTHTKKTKQKTTVILIIFW